MKIFESGTYIEMHGNTYRIDSVKPRGYGYTNLTTGERAFAPFKVFENAKEVRHVKTK